MERLLERVHDGEEEIHSKRIVPKTWRDQRRGIGKLNLGLEFVSMARATDLSTVTFEVDQIENAQGLDSKILMEGAGKREYKMGTAETPTDCYIEVLLKRMLIGEYSQCFIVRRSSKNLVSFTVRLKMISRREYIHRLQPVEVFELAQQYKETGVRMFKRKYHTHAHGYFSRAQKLICSLTPVDKSLGDFRVEEEGVNGTEMIFFLRIVLHNISACLLLEERYEEAVNLLDSLMDCSDFETWRSVDPLFEKAMYRKAQALFKLKRYDETITCLEQLDYKASPQLKAMYKTATEQVGKKDEEYVKMVKKMFK